MSEVKNEGLEVVGYLVGGELSESRCLVTGVTNEPLCRHSEALALVAGLRVLVSAERDQLRAELAQLKAQEPAAWEIYYADDDSFHAITRDKALIEGYSKMAYTIKPLYTAPVAKPAVMPERATTDNTCADPKWLYGWNSCLDQFARLNAAADQGGKDE